MKQILFLSTLLLLTACNSTPSVTNDNQNKDLLPLFMDLNNNVSTFVPAGNINDNQNSTDFMILNDNANSIPENSNMNTVESGSDAAVDVTLVVPHATPFDCKALSVYEGMDFYADFLRLFEALPRYTAAEMKVMLQETTSADDQQTIVRQARTTRETRENIISSCLAKDNSLFLVMSEGDKSRFGFKIARYNIAAKVLDVAQREDMQHGTVWSATPESFGRRDGVSLLLNSTDATSEKTEWFTLAYDYVANYVKVVDYCVKPVGKAKTCAQYPY